MTKEKNELVEDNIKIAYYMANKWHKKLIHRINGYNKSFDEILSDCMFGITKAANSYDSNKSKFMTYAARVIDNQVLMSIKNSKKFSNDVQLIVKYNEQNDLNVNPWEAIADKCALDDSIKLKEVITSINCLKDKEKKALLMTANGYSQAEIGEEMGITQSYISRMVKGARLKLDRMTS